MDQQLIDKVIELVVSKLTEELKSDQNSNSLSEVELRDWQVNDLLKSSADGQISSTKTYNLQSLSVEELADWQSLNVYYFSTDETKEFDKSPLIKLRKFN